MNIQKLLKKQAEFDQRLTTLNLPSPEVLKTKRILAISVELAEFSNEWAGFKYWKPHHQIDHAKMHAEFADIGHFLCSLALILELEPVIESKIAKPTIDEQILDLFSAVIKLQKAFTKDQIRTVFELYLGLGKMVGMTDEMIEEAYFAKSKTSFERLNNVPQQFKKV